MHILLFASNTNALCPYEVHVALPQWLLKSPCKLEGCVETGWVGNQWTDPSLTGFLADMLDFSSPQSHRLMTYDQEGMVADLQQNVWHIIKTIINGGRGSAEGGVMTPKHGLVSSELDLRYWLVIVETSTYLWRRNVQKEQKCKGHAISRSLPLSVRLLTFRHVV